MSVVILDAGEFACDDVSPTPVPLTCAVDVPEPLFVEAVAVAGAFGSLKFSGLPPLAPGEEKLKTVSAPTLTLLVRVDAIERLAAASMYDIFI